MGRDTVAHHRRAADAVHDGIANEGFCHGSLAVSRLLGEQVCECFRDIGEFCHCVNLKESRDSDEYLSWADDCVKVVIVAVLISCESLRNDYFDD